MTKERSCDRNEIHNTEHDYIYYKYVGNQCMHPDWHIHKIGEK